MRLLVEVEVSLDVGETDYRVGGDHQGNYERGDNRDQDEGHKESRVGGPDVDTGDGRGTSFFGRLPAAMSRGVVLWPDVATSEVIRGIWRLLEEHGLPTLATHTHRLHQPHASLTVGEDLPLAEVGAVPAKPLPLRIESLGVFPGGAAFLAPVVTDELLGVQRAVYEAVKPLMVDPWPYFVPGGWVPLITVSMGMTPVQLGEALPVIWHHLPLHGTFDRAGVEDGTTGDSWPIQSRESV